MFNINQIDSKILLFFTYQSIFIQIYHYISLEDKNNLKSFLINLYKNLGLIIISYLSLWTINLTKEMHTFLSMYITSLVVFEFKEIFKSYFQFNNTNKRKQKVEDANDIGIL